jgi:hypothetical protein
MKYLSVVCFIVMLILPAACGQENEHNVLYEADIIIYGGTSAAVIGL